MEKKIYLRIIITFCAIVFIAINAIVIYTYIQNNRKPSITSFQVTEFANGVSNKKTITGNLIELDNNFTLITDDFQIYGLGGSSIELTNDSLKLNKGTVLLSGQNFNLELQGSRYLLANKYKVLIDAEDGVITTDGDAAFNNKILNLNSQLLFVGSQIEQYDFERSKLTSDDRYKSLITFLSDQGYLYEFFKDFTPPELISISPRDNFITQERFVRLYGYTEVNSKIIFDDELLVAVSDGYFTKQIDLEEGSNIVRFTLADTYGNKKLVTLNYTRKKINLVSVPSYPVSGPVSYPN